MGKPICESGEWSGDRCGYDGDADELVTVEFMPRWLRESHDAARNRGAYPHNGSQRVRVCPECAEDMIEADGEWCRIIEE